MGGILFSVELVAFLLKGSIVSARDSGYAIVFVGEIPDEECYVCVWFPSEDVS